jgi:hypothetical protein
MRRILFVALVAAGCGGSQKPTTPPPPLADQKETPPETKPEAKPEAKPEEAKEPPPGPVDVTVAAPKVTVKLVSAGKGTKAALKVAPKQGEKQNVELALDFSGEQAGPPEAGGTQKAIYPTIVLTGSAEVKTSDKDGSTYEVAVTGTDVRENQGQQIPTNVMKQALELVKDLKIGGTIAGNGAAGDVKFHVDKADRSAAQVLELVRGATLPAWPVLPNEPIGVGAKWQVTATTRVQDKLDVTQTTDYELVEHKGNKWTLKGTTKVTGTDQKVDGAQISGIKGSGTIEVAMLDGALYPSTAKTKMETEFDAKILPDPSEVKDPSAAKAIDIHFDLKQGTQVTQK